MKQHFHAVRWRLIPDPDGGYWTFGNEWASEPGNQAQAIGRLAGDAALLAVVEHTGQLPTLVEENQGNGWVTQLQKMSGVLMRWRVVRCVYSLPKPAYGVAGTGGCLMQQRAAAVSEQVGKLFGLRVAEQPFYLRSHAMYLVTEFAPPSPEEWATRDQRTPPASGITGGV